LSLAHSSRTISKANGGSSHRKRGTLTLVGTRVMSTASVSRSGSRCVDFSFSCPDLRLLCSTQKPPSKPINLSPGDAVVGFRRMHTLEAALRADARRQGRFICAGNERSFGDVETFRFACILRVECSYIVRMRREQPDQNGRPRWRCIEIHGIHSCHTSADPPAAELSKRMDFFVRYVCPLLCIQSLTLPSNSRRFTSRTDALARNAGSKDHGASE
jgi:hypothetical protein